MLYDDDTVEILFLAAHNRLIQSKEMVVSLFTKPDKPIKTSILLPISDQMRLKWENICVGSLEKGSR